MKTSHPGATLSLLRLGTGLGLLPKPFIASQFTQRTLQHLFRSIPLVDDYSVADIASFTWVRAHEWAGIDIGELPHLKRWLSAIASRPAAQRGLENPLPLVHNDRLEAARAMTTA